MNYLCNYNIVVKEGVNTGKMNVLVSVIIPVYNTDLDMLRQCVYGVFGQSFQDFELIIIDDCSTNPNVVEYLDSLCSVSNQVRVFHSKQNKGISGSRNEGIMLAKGKWLCFLDHDDWWEKDYLQDLVRGSKAADTDMVISGYTVVDEDGTPVKYVPEKGKESFFASPWFIYSYAAPWNRLLRKDFLLDNHIKFPEGCLTEDITFNITCNALAHNPQRVVSRGYCNRINPNSTSRSRKFSAMNYEEMPFKDIKKNCSLIKRIQDEERKNIHKAAVAEHLTVIICVFACESDWDTLNRARKQAAHLIRKHMTGYVRRALEYNRCVPSRMAMKIIYFGYMVAIRLYLDRIYCVLIHTLLNFLMRFA